MLTTKHTHAEIEESLKAFSFGQLQDFCTLLSVLETQKISLEDFVGYVEKEQRVDREEVKILKTLVKSCPKCQILMRLLPVNFTRATVTGDDSKSVWLCPNQKCMYTIYNKESIAEIQTAERGGT